MANSGGSNTGIRGIPYLLHPASDAFGRLRVGTPQTIFDSKQLYDKSPLFWDEGTISGAGMSSAFVSNQAGVEISSTATTAGHFARQTFMRFNYQPGKSQRIFLTGILNTSGGGTGVTSRMGYFDANNGMFFQLREGNFELGLRSNTSGSPVDTIITESEMNGDQIPDSMGVALRDLDLDFTKTQIFAISFEWLGVGSVVYSVFQDATEYILHVQNHANSLDKVYMSTPNLPLRYELITTAESAASKMTHICSTVISEGGTQDTGILRYRSTEGAQLDANAANTLYALGGIRLKSTHLDATINIERLSLLAETNDNFEWVWVLNPTVAGTFTYSDETNSAVQTAVGATANTVSGGTQITGGFANSSESETLAIPNAIRLGSAIDGTPDELVLAVRPLSANLDIQGGLTWRELL